jgi:hypothetical protein
VDREPSLFLHLAGDRGEDLLPFFVATTWEIPFPAARMIFFSAAESEDLTPLIHDETFLDQADIL